MMEPVPIYHFTHIDNLASIVECGEIRCNNLLWTGDLGHMDIAHQHIQDRRSRTKVPYGPQGVLHDYVPFYFAPRSPMLYAIHRGNVQSYSEGQRPLVYLVSSVAAVQARGLKYVFTDGHATVALSNFYDDPARLDQIDWTVMGERYWNNTLEDPDRRRRREAEFLVYKACPFEVVDRVVVIDQSTRRQVEAILAGSLRRPQLLIRRDWYF